MSYALSHGVKLYYAEAGSGMPLIFAHEFAGDFRSWRPRDPRSLGTSTLSNPSR